MTAKNRFLAIAAFALTFYGLGAATVERFVNYQTWPKVGATSFQAYHNAQRPLIQVFIVAPMGLCFLAQLALAVSRPPGLSRRLVWTPPLASLGAGIATVFLQVPIHNFFDLHGFDQEAWGRLLRTDWLRKAAAGIEIVATLMIVNRLLLPQPAAAARASLPNNQ